MPAHWTKEEEREKYKELYQLYAVEKKTIFEIGEILGITYNTVFNQLQHVGIPTDPHRKPNYYKRNKVAIPKTLNEKLAEFVGIMLGDGHLSFRTGQFYITVNKITDYKYIEYVTKLIFDLFQIKPSITNYKRIKELNVSNVLVTSVDLMKYLQTIGLISANKVKDQIDVPGWIFRERKLMEGFLRGFFDTDGSIYKLKFGVQMAFRNYSIPLLTSTQHILARLGFHPSKISTYHIYLTRKEDLKRYIKEIGFSNPKHFKRAQSFGILSSNYNARVLEADKPS